MSWPAGNLLLDALPPGDPAFAAAEGVRVVSLARGEGTTVENTVMVTVDFPLTALMSVTGMLQDGTSCEVASVGPEGWVEIDAALGASVALRSATCQFAGDAVRWPLESFQRARAESPRFAWLTGRAVRARVFITEQNVMCHLRHTVVERLARWLLVARQRLRRDDLEITHEFLASTLGARRAGVSEAAAALQERGGIRYSRGLVTISSPAILIGASCECFAECERALLGVFD